MGAALVVVGAALVVVVGAGVVVVGAWLVVVSGGCVDGCGGGGTTVTVVVPFGAVIVSVCDVCGGAGSLGGMVLTGFVLSWPRVSANTTARSTAAAAPTTLNTSAVRLYHGSEAGTAA
ncbi:hypothetical protein [Mycobacterium interjectum]|uniref:hypothetical protein n=1 Tax=Mycobacterium interjectum TaxID=33895 RepID=UPI00082F2E11|nr:hypothetical protein [Mycobacterium interjectum]